MLIKFALGVACGMMVNALWDFFRGLKDDDAKEAGGGFVNAILNAFIAYALWRALP